jgi:spore coat protein U-like protein
VTCTNSTPYEVGLDAGTGTGATIAARKMTASGATINYTMYQDPARSILWGNTVGTDAVSGTGNGSAQALTVYGRVPAQSTPAPGAYSDTINVTVTF